MTAPSAPVVHAARFDELSAARLYDLLRLRVDVFVVEQGCPYPELDGRDTEPGALHLWTAGDVDDAGRATAYLRLLADPDGSARIGRVCTDRDHRGQGLAARLVTHALARSEGRRTVLAAQSHLRGWYARFGFAPAGAEFLEDGIPHTPMAREQPWDRPAQTRQ